MPTLMLLRDYCASYAPPPAPPFICHAYTPYTIGNGNYRVKAKAALADEPIPSLEKGRTPRIKGALCA